MNISDLNFVGILAAFASLSHRLFGGENFKVWLIETSNDALNLTIAAAVITYFNQARIHRGFSAIGDHSFGEVA